MSANSLGNRIKRYERASEHHFTPRTPLFIRVDGRAFHTFTRECERPFDPRVINAMVMAAVNTAKDMQGFTLGYAQSDEATFMLTDTARLETEAWFDYNAAKVISVSASLMTANFNRAWSVGGGPGRLAVFDSRAFSVPADDAPNVFLWRMRDWERNSLQMLARAHFSHRELHQKKTSHIHEMLHGRGVNWAELPAQLRNGTVIYPAHAKCPDARWGYEEWRRAVVEGMEQVVVDERVAVVIA